jgi:ATP-dependent RNA helicase RhlE
LKAPLPVVGGAPWAADIVAAAPKPGQNRGQRPGNGGRQGQKLTAKPQAPRGQGKPSGQGRPQGQGKPGGQRPAKPQGGSFAPRRDAR